MRHRRSGGGGGGAGPAVAALGGPGGLEGAAVALDGGLPLVHEGRQHPEERRRVRRLGTAAPGGGIQSGLLIGPSYGSRSPSILKNHSQKVLKPFNVRIRVKAECIILLQSQSPSDLILLGED